MEPIKFKLKHKLYPEYFWVYIFNTRQQMLKLADANKDCDAFVSSYERIKINKDGIETISKNIGNIYFNKRYIKASVVSHEIVHAALWLYRMNQSKSANFGDECSEDEETFAYMYNRLFRKITLKLYKLGLWK